MTPPPPAEDLRARLTAALERAPLVRLAYLFGSFARGEAREGSDVDVAVSFDDAERRDLDALAEVLEGAVEARVDLVDLDRAPPLLLRDIVRNGVCLLARDDDERAEFELQAVSSYLDTEHLRDVQLGYLRARAEARRAPPT